MGVDRPEEDDLPRPDDTPRDAGVRPGRVAVEERDRSEYYDALREAVDGVAEDTWTAATDRFRESWAEHCERWPEEARKPPDRSADPPDSWRGESGRYLDGAANTEVEERCERIAAIERTVISPAMQEIESCDPDRHLAGFDHRLKGPDRLKDKIAAQFEAQPDLSCSEAMSLLKDSLRFTFCYPDDRYAEGMSADTDRMLAHGFERVDRRNTWADDLYRGINSRWREPETGLMFEVQFHTETSYEAKQLTHVAYERLRDTNTTRTERRELEALQRDVTGSVNVPPGVLEIEDYY
jgi:hypothetical protein